jgi:hypothetical protein
MPRSFGQGTDPVPTELPLGMDRRRDHDGGNVRRWRSHVCCVDCRSRCRAARSPDAHGHSQNCAFWTSGTILSEAMLHLYKNEKWQEPWPLRKEQSNMAHIANKPSPKLRKAPQPPLSRPGATPDTDRAKRPSLAEPTATDQELTPGDRVEGLGNFGTPTGEFGTVQKANEDDAVVKWDDDGRVRVHQPSLKKV